MRINRRVVFWGLAFLTLLILLFVFSSILLPFVAGAALAYLLDPLADWFERQGFSRLAATMTLLVLFIVVLVALMLLVLPILVNQLILLAQNIPYYLERLDIRINSILQSRWAESLGVDPAAVRSSLASLLSQGSSWFTTVVTGLWSGGLAVINILALLVVTPVVAFYLLYDWDRMIDLVDSWVPRDSVEEVRLLASEIDRVLAGFVRGQALVSLTLGTFYAAGLVLLGVNFGFLIGLAAGIVSFDGHRFHSERRLGPWLETHRSEVFLATKTGEREAGPAYDEIRRSLERLRVDQVDLIQLHNLVDEAEWQTALGPGGALEAAVRARDEGLVRFIGVTGHGVTVAAQHRRSLERFDFDSVLLPFSYTMMRNPVYAADFEALAALCAERNVAMQTIKAITRAPWGEQTPTANTWYDPLRDQDDIDLAVHWVLGRPGVFLNTVGDITILPLVLDAAARFETRPSEAAMDQLLAQQAMEPLFV